MSSKHEKVDSQTKESTKIKFQVGEDPNGLTRSTNGQMEKTAGKKLNQAQPIPQGFSSGLLLAYAALIIVGVLLGRLLWQRNSVATKLVSSPSVAAAVAPTDPAFVTPAGFTCPNPQPKVETTAKEVNLLIWVEYLPADWFACFEHFYNVKVNRTEFATVEEMFGFLQAGDKQYDLVQIGDEYVVSLGNEGQLAKIDKSRLPNFQNLNPAFLNPPFDPGNHFSIPFQFGSTSITVNTNVVKTLPTSWADLWRPEYAGQLMFADESREVIGVALMAEGYSYNTTDRAALDAVKPKVLELAKGIKKLESGSQSTTLLSGVANIGVLWNGEAALAQRANPAIRYIYPKEGAIFWQDNYALPLHAQHLDLVYAWLNYTLQGNMAWMMMRDFPYTNPNTAAIEYAQHNYPELYKQYVESPITNVPPDEVLQGHWSESVGEIADVYDAMWSEIKQTVALADSQ